MICQQVFVTLHDDERVEFRTIYPAGDVAKIEAMSP